MNQKDLGLDSQIRRDYLYGSLLSEGTVASEDSPAAVLGRSSSKITPYVVSQGLGKQGSVVAFEAHANVPAEDTGEAFDVVVVGAGLSGLAAAYYVQQETDGRARILILENHEMFGGNSRRDEFQINGQTLYAPQASTVIQDLPPALAPSERASSLFRELGIDLQKIRVPEDQYFFGIFRDDDRVAGPAWYPNIFAAPLSETAKKDLGAFFETVMHFYDDGDWRTKLATLDKITSEISCASGIGRMSCFR